MASKVARDPRISCSLVYVLRAIFETRQRLELALVIGSCDLAELTLRRRFSGWELEDVGANGRSS